MFLVLRVMLGRFFSVLLSVIELIRCSIQEGEAALRDDPGRYDLRHIRVRL
jgi:hypothetical protein